MKTLVIHPVDSTTDFLKEIYREKGWTILTLPHSKKYLKKQIKEHDRIIMLGHGDQTGLYGHKRMMIDSTWIYLLRSKYCVCIWCNADKFVEKYGLTGFYTGMIISDDMEANMYNINATEREIHVSNELFAFSINIAIFTADPVGIAKINYHLPGNNIVNFNRNNIYHTT